MTFTCAIVSVNFLGSGYKGQFLISLVLTAHRIAPSVGFHRPTTFPTPNYLSCMIERHLFQEIPWWLLPPQEEFKTFVSDSFPDHHGVGKIIISVNSLRQENKNLRYPRSNTERSSCNMADRSVLGLRNGIFICMIPWSLARMIWICVIRNSLGCETGDPE
jgi:hypothetical protein